ncbi:hypothetical protein RHSIM_Rhsim06G0128600 [Rhododendron simsii]|uniref:Cation-transporting P-type ATPase N-terminal domain-containing protein n=1 Tax=Rhododendron simsii TaxID=118357 RepID=A0A834GUG6_RHOSS|nr:hypothetical protein RHSIM_Rhsim06G0128600 [Rhododendron simsii]
MIMNGCSLSLVTLSISPKVFNSKSHFSSSYGSIPPLPSCVSYRSIRSSWKPFQGLTLQSSIGIEGIKGLICAFRVLEHLTGNELEEDFHMIWVPTNLGGAERLALGIIESESDFYLHTLWGLPNEIHERYHRTSPFCCSIMMVGTSECDEFEWSKQAIHISVWKLTKWWYAKRFLHPRIVATYDYVFIRDDDLGVEHFDPEDFSSRETEERRCTDPHLPPCAAYVFNLLKSWQLCFLEMHGAVFGEKVEWWWRTLAFLPYIISVRDTWKYWEAAYYLYPFSGRKELSHFLRSNTMLLENAIQILETASSFLPFACYGGRTGYRHVWIGLRGVYVLTVLVWYSSPGVDPFKQEDFLQVDLLDPELEFDRERDKSEEALRSVLSAKKPHFSHCLEWLLLVFDAEISRQSANKNQISLPMCAAKLSVLENTGGLIKSFPEYFDVVVSIARKIDGRHWADLFFVAGRSIEYVELFPLEEVFEQLRTSRGGLTSEDAEVRLQIFGPNKLEEKTEIKILKFLSFMWNPLSWAVEVASVMAIVLANGGGQGPDWQDFIGIVCLLPINSTISFIEENNAGNVAASLVACLAPKTKVCIVFPFFFIQPALVRESLSVTKRTGDEVFSSSTCKPGEIEAVVIATGVHPLFGKGADLIDSTEVVGHFQQVLTSIGNFCICSIAVGMLLEIVVMYLIQHRSYRWNQQPSCAIDWRNTHSHANSIVGHTCNQFTSTLSAGTTLDSYGSGAITKRMTTIEEMAGMDVLCSDKTGTLTLNRLTVDRNFIELAARASRLENQDAIDTAIVSMLADPKEILNFCEEKEQIVGKCMPLLTSSLNVACGLLELLFRAEQNSGDQLSIAKETGRRLGMGTNMYPSSSLLGRETDGIEALSVDELIEKADGFAGVFPVQTFKSIPIFSLNDITEKADIGIFVTDATDAARSAFDIVLTEPGSNVIINAVLTSRAMFQRMKNYTFLDQLMFQHLHGLLMNMQIYAVSITIWIVLGFTLLALIWEYDFPPFMVLIIAILNDGSIMTISQDRVKPSPGPDSWKLNEIFATGVVIGTYLALVTVLFYWVAEGTSFFEVTESQHELSKRKF